MRRPGYGAQQEIGELFGILGIEFAVADQLGHVAGLKGGGIEQVTQVVFCRFHGRSGFVDQQIARVCYSGNQCDSKDDNDSDHDKRSESDRKDGRNWQGSHCFFRRG